MIIPSFRDKSEKFCCNYVADFLSFENSYFSLSFPRSKICAYLLPLYCHGVPFVIKTIRITSKVSLHCNKTRSFRPITILITNQTKPPIDLTCFDCLRETETALDSLVGNRTRLSSTGLKLIEIECQQMKSNENEIRTHFNGSFAVPFTMTIKAIVISNQDCFDGEWNALYVPKFYNHNRG